MSALDGRIRKLAREAAEAALRDASYSVGTLEVVEDTGPDRVAELETQVADLRGRIERMEKAATTAGITSRRTARKTEPSE